MTGIFEAQAQECAQLSRRWGADLLPFTADWSLVSSLVTPQGAVGSTDWQQAHFSITTPIEGSPQPVGLTFATFGYDADQWWALVDDVTWEIE
jgi:hypothetical protein